ncbi:hypothetical protein [Peribacillus asahii]|uniref:hypothetical protein n=1 Tax=Peribacillus asahii TaxID=228899 RepID=UPI00207A3CA2|nr:hypothetical protein [Peribacillus asahii]USK60651.1 hypothetical protein LIT37_04820 [Peribacillus asahii]
MTGVRPVLTVPYIFILCGEALIFALHEWLTGAIVQLEQLLLVITKLVREG